MFVRFRALAISASLLLPFLTPAQTPTAARVPHRPFRSLTEQPLPPSTPVPLTGLVVTDSGEPLPGATVRVKGAQPNLICSTNRDGHFSLTLPSYQLWPVVMCVDYVGYDSRLDTLTPQTMPTGHLRYVLRPVVQPAR